MTQWRDPDQIPAAWIAAEQVVAVPQQLPDPETLDLIEWLRRVPEYLAPLEMLGEGLLPHRPGERIDAAEVRLAGELVHRLSHLRRHFEMVRRLADDRDMFAETFDATREPWRNWQREHAFRAWRDGERQVAHPAAAKYRDEYEVAIAQMLAFLQRFSIVDEMVATYFGEGYQAPLRDACASDPRQARIWHVVILDAACWRRVRQLLAGLPDHPRTDHGGRKAAF